MAYTEKYRIEWLSYAAWHTYRISIYELGYDGPVLQRKLQRSGGARLIKDKGNSVNRVSLEFSVMCLTDWEFIEPFTPNFRKHKVVLTEDDTELFSGYLVPNQHSEPYIDPPYPVSLTAVNGLGLLENIDYTNLGLISPYTIIKNCLDLTGISLELRLFSSLSEDTMLGEKRLYDLEGDYTVVDSLHPLREALVNDAQYTDSNCLEVLEAIAENFNLQIQQQNNEWWVYDITNIEEASVLVSTTGWETPTAATSLIQELGKVNESDCWISGQLSQQLNEGVTGVDYEFAPELKTSLLQNTSLSNLVDGVVTDWQATAGISIFTIALGGTVYSGIAAATYPSVGSNFVYQSFDLVTSANQILNLSFNVAAVGPIVRSDFKALMRVIATDGTTTNYLKSDGTWSTSEQSIIKTITSVNANQFSESNFAELAINDIEIPLSGTVTVQLYQLYNENYYVTEMVSMFALWKDVTVIIANDDGYTYDDLTLTLSEECDEILSGSSLSQSFKHSDVPQIADNGTLLYTGVIDVNGTASEYWGGIPLMQAIANRQLHMEWYSSHVLNGTVRGQNISLMSLVSHSYRSKRTYYLESGEHNLLNNTLSGTWKEWSHGNALFEDAESIFCLVGETYLVNCNGAWAEVINAETGLVRFDYDVDSIFWKDNSRFWRAAITSDLYYDISNPRDWLLSEFTQLNLATYGTEETQRRLFFRNYIGVKSSILPILVYTTERTAEESNRINKALRNPQYITEGYTPIEEDAEAITESATTHINAPSAITEDSESITENNENITQ